MLPVLGLYTQIRSNYFRSALLLVGLFVMIYLVAYVIIVIIFTAKNEQFVSSLVKGDVAPLIYQAISVHSNDNFLKSLPFVTTGVTVWIFLGFLLQKIIISSASGAHEVSRKEAPELYNLLENLSISCGMEMPQLQIIETQSLNAFASGLASDTATVTVTRGLLERLDNEELEAVLAHELTHIRNQDILLMVIAAVIVGSFSMFCEMMFRNLGSGLRLAFYSRGSFGSDSSGLSKSWRRVLVVVFLYFLVMCVLWIAWIIALSTNFALSRRREYLADAGAVELTKNPNAMISALKKISTNSDLPSVSTNIMQMCIDNPRSNLFDLFSTHPTIDQRIEALVHYAGGCLPVRKNKTEKTKELLRSPWQAQSSPWSDEKQCRKVFGRRNTNKKKIAGNSAQHV